MASEETRKPEHAHSKVYEWEGRIAIVGYTGSPYPDNPWDIERGSPEARAATFVLTEVSDLGIMASRILREQKEDEILLKLDDPIFIPWASVHSIRLLETSDEPSEDDE